MRFKSKVRDTTKIESGPKSVDRFGAHGPALKSAALFFAVSLLLSLMFTFQWAAHSQRSMSQMHVGIGKAVGKGASTLIPIDVLARIKSVKNYDKVAVGELKQTLARIVKNDSKVSKLAIYLVIGGKLVHIASASSTAGTSQNSVKVLTPAKISPALKSCLSTGAQSTVVSAGTTDSYGRRTVYTRLKMRSGIGAVLETEVSGAVMARDIQLIKEVKANGILTAFVLSFGMGLVGLYLARRLFGKQIEMSVEMIETSSKLTKTEGELSSVLNQSKQLTASLIQTLLSAGCMVWTGRATVTKENEFIWAGELKYRSPYEWLTECLAMDATFDRVWDGLRDSSDQEAWRRTMLHAIRNRLPSASAEYRIRLGDEKVVWFSEQLTFTYDQDGTVNVNGFVTDISESRQKSEEVRKLAFYDTVTGLINRTRIHDLITEMLIDNPLLSVIGVEISNFRNINESWGAEIGDRLLKEFGTALQETVGQSGVVGRLAGDDFVVIASDPQLLSTLVTRLDDTCRKPTVLEDIEITKMCRIGYVTAEPKESAVGLIRKVNLALENARKNQSPFAVAYKPEMSFRAKMRVELETAMRQALMDGEFYLMFQPIVDTATGQVVKAEALLRWNSSRFGAVSPATFIPIAEESDFINDLGNYVIDETARRISMMEAHLPHQEFVISMNLSLRQLKSPATLNVFKAALQRWGIEPERMIIEVTESSIMHDAGECVAMLNLLRDQGFMLAIDDFGTGYSSLATLASLPFGCLKIDKRFVDGIGIDPKQEQVLQTIIRLARALNLKIVAEGIEYKQQYEFLKSLEVEYCQGYFFAKPLSFEDLLARTEPATLAA